MVTEQETLIYIEDQDKHDASVAANAFAHKDVKNRAYINTLGAELALKYLASENIDVSNIYNIHSIKKILEEMDISDIMLPNIHMDVRVVFDENVIFIPKSHFEYNLVPDIYLVFNLAKDFSHVKFLGFFEPKLINKNNANKDYYFIEKEKLNPALDLKKYIETHKGNTSEKLTEEDLVNSERIIIAMADNDISEDEKKFLIKQLAKSAELRDRFIEFENFETLSYKAMTDPQIHKKTDITELSAISAPPEIENNEETIEPEQEVANETIQQTEENVENSTEAMDLELEPVEDLNFTQFEELTDTNSDTTENMLTETPNLEDTANILNTLETDEAAATAIGTDEILNTSSDSTEQIIDVNLPETLDTNFQMTDDITFDDNTTISFENIDTSEIDNINIEENNNQQEDTISFNDIEMAEERVQSDFIDTIDNKISFDDVPSDNILAEPAPLNIDETVMSLNDVDTTSLETLNNEPQYTEETISFDDIETPEETAKLDFDENLIDNTISFDDVELENNEENNVQDIGLDDDRMSFENVSENISTEIDDFMDDTLDLEDNNIEPLDEKNSSTVEAGDNVTENMNTQIITPASLPEQETDTDTDTIENIIPETPQQSEIEPEIVEETDVKSEGFGKNLLDNLSSENLDDISIENLGLDDDIPTANAEDISSSDLLSQIDDVLNSSHQPEPDAGQDFSLEDIPEISDFNSSNDTDTVPITGTDNFDDTENQSVAPLNTETVDDDIPNTEIDDLLNFESNEAGDEDNIGVLFNDTDPDTDNELDAAIAPENFEMQDDAIEQMEQQQVPGAALFQQKNQSADKKKIIIVAAALVTILAAASAVAIFKPKNDNSSDIEPLTSTNTGTEAVNTPIAQTPETASQNQAEDILAENAPAINKAETKEVQKAQPAKELKSTPSKPKKLTSDAYMTVNRLVWDVPGNLSYSTKMQNYLRTAGKSIKLSLSADLLLANEYAYTNQVKVNIKLSKTGVVQDANITSSSGSTQIDNIVLQSVKDTLNVVKPPSDEIKTPDFNLGLIIYF